MPSKIALVNRNTKIVSNTILADTEFANQIHGHDHYLIILEDGEACESGSLYVGAVPLDGGDPVIALAEKKDLAIKADRFVLPPPAPRYDAFRMELSQADAYKALLSNTKNITWACQTPALLYHLDKGPDYLEELERLWAWLVKHRPLNAAEVAKLNQIATRHSMPFSFGANGVIILRSGGGT